MSFEPFFKCKALKKKVICLSEIRYLCTGSCGKMVTVAAYRQGQKRCVDKSCDNAGSSLERGEYCSQCNTSFDEGEGHICV